MTLEQKQLDRVANIVANIFNQCLHDDPSLGRFLTYSPAYRYFRRKGSKDQYFYTTDSVQHNGKPHYASGIYRYIKTKKAYKLTQERYHAKRKDAKARALQLWEVSKPLSHGNGE